jgi:hypothetical protein
MADHKFEFTLSGAQLSDEQKLRISNEIAIAVTKVVVGDTPELLAAPMFSICRINGGKNIMGPIAQELLTVVEKAPNSARFTAGLTPA